MDFHISVQKRHVMTIVIVMSVLIGLGIVVADHFVDSVPGVGHDIDEIEPCDFSGQILKYLGGSQKWSCGADIGSAQFVGVTPTMYLGGEVGGYNGGDEKCAVTFGAGSRMCYAGDFVQASGRPPGNFDAWYNGFVYSLDTSLNYHNGDCRGWTENQSIYKGLTWTGTSTVGYPGDSECDNPRRILCCR